MPGYGYAAVSKSKVNSWTKLMRAYLRGRATNWPRVYILLVDGRHGLKKTVDADDRDVLDQLRHVHYQAVLTKRDEVKKEPKH